MTTKATHEIIADDPAAVAARDAYNAAQEAYAAELYRIAGDIVREVLPTAAVYLFEIEHNDESGTSVSAMFAKDADGVIVWAAKGMDDHEGAADWLAFSEQPENADRLTQTVPALLEIAADVTGEYPSLSDDPDDSDSGYFEPRELVITAPIPADATPETFADHTNDMGDACAWSGQLVPAGHDDDRCPGGCADSWIRNQRGDRAEV